MEIYDLNNHPVELIPVDMTQGALITVPGTGRTVSNILFAGSAMATANRAVFDLGRFSKSATPALQLGRPTRGAARRAAAPAPKPAAFIDAESELLRTVYKEIVLRFRPKIAERTRTALLKKYGMRVVRTNRFVTSQLVVEDAQDLRQGIDLIEIANALRGNEEVRFATPNFVSQYRRHVLPKIPGAQWHLRNRGRLSGQKRGEDVGAAEAWKRTQGRPSVIIAVLDDGVDIDHPALRSRVWRNPKGQKEQGRDFTLKNDHADHYNPRPKVFQPPYDDFDVNDIHGTACAGVALANHPDCYGIAPKCRLLAVKIFQANSIAADERVADAIRYAGTIASVISLSWSGGRTPDIQAAIEDVGRSRRGRGVVVFAATGNAGKRVEWPAADPNAVAVGASTDQGKLADYSNVGAQVSIVAPSGGGVAEIFTTDVSTSGRGFNLGDVKKGGKDGLFCNDFSGTSSATPLAAGVGALVLSVNAALSRDEVKGILQTTAVKIGKKSSYDASGHSNDFGYGRVNAGAAVNAAD